MFIRVLGPLELEGETGRLPLGAPKQRLVLALLLAHAGTVVPIADIVDELWGDRPPPSAEPNVRLYANNLRRTLAAAPGGPGLARRGRGYLLSVAEASFDLFQFRRLVASGRAALRAGDGRSAADRLAEGLGLWRGPAAADLPTGRLLAGWRDAVADEKLSAMEDHVEALLGLNLTDEALTTIGAVVTGNPLRERAHALLIRARYQSGDVAGALAAYDSARGQLVDQLGIEPGTELAQLQKAILNRDPALSPPRSSRTPPGPAGSPSASNLDGFPPRQLPADVVAFVGRSAYLRDQNLRDVPVLIFTGPAGIGKTALAVRWAHRVSDEFPDGQLYVNLGGFDPLRAPVAPGTALYGFLKALGVPAARIPAGVDARAALFRTVLTGRRILLLLDNARDVTQVRPLLPGAADCLTLITSRNQLTGLVAVEGARPIVLDLLDPTESRELLAGRLGRDRLAAKPDAVAKIVAACGGLPLALALIAASAATRPEFTLAALAAEMCNVQTRLDVLALGDRASDMRDVLSWSYRLLSAPAARLFRLLGAHGGSQTSAAAVASLVGAPLPEVRPTLTELTRLHLIIESAPGRYAFHDLVRAYAVELAGEDPADEGTAARRRLLDHYVRTACAATDHLAARHETFALADPEPGVTPEWITDADAALAWFTIEENVLLAAIPQAFDAGLDAYAFQLAWALMDFENRRGRWDVLVASQRVAVDAARRLGDRAARACAHRHLAIAYANQRRFEAALTEARHAGTLYEQLGNEAGQGRADLLTADLLQEQEHFGAALEHAERALGRFRAIGDRSGQSSALGTIGWQHAQLGQYERAVTASRSALDLQREFGDRYGEAHSWHILGYAHHHLGDRDQAFTCFRRALDLFEQLGHRVRAAAVLDHLGDAQRATGDSAAAAATWRRALLTVTELSGPCGDKVRAKLGSIGAAGGCS